jgi:DNA polymerase/3'-5' exonuclease PolX
LAVRTGSAEYAHKVLACGWVKRGYKSRKGRLTKENGWVLAVPEEKTLFDWIGIPYAEPKDREYTEFPYADFPEP